MENNDKEEQVESSGSWWPLMVVVILFFARWLAYGEGNLPVRFRRWYNMERVQRRKQMGYRDDSAYKSGAAGHGASASVKRQG